MIAFARTTMAADDQDESLLSARRAVAEALLSPTREAPPAIPASWKCWLLAAWMLIVSAVGWSLLLIG
ncbi:MAG: hypothetical protein AB7O68_02210 [Pirellulales bacterium]